MHVAEKGHNFCHVLLFTPNRCEQLSDVEPFTAAFCMECSSANLNLTSFLYKNSMFFSHQFCLQKFWGFFAPVFSTKIPEFLPHQLL
jgi:hypothetical protein